MSKRVEIRTLDQALEAVLKSEAWGPALRENQAEHAWRIDEDLERLAAYERRLLQGESVVIVHPYGRLVRYTL